MSVPNVIEKYHSLPNIKPKSIANYRKIKNIEIYDFDNTLFNSPAPNPNIITKSALNILSYPYQMQTGGWWCQPSYLDALVDEWLEDRHHLSLSSENSPIEHDYNNEDCQCDECKVDRKYWNSHVCKLMFEASLKEQDTITIIMTGRRDDRFAPVMEKIFANTVFKRKIEVNAVFLKDPTFSSTMAYKTQVLSDLLFFFKPNYLKMYDDRPHQIGGFKSFLYDFVKQNKHKLPFFKYDVILVPKLVRYLPAYKERLLLEEEIEQHNQIMKQKILSNLSDQSLDLSKENGNSSFSPIHSCGNSNGFKEIAFDGLEISDKKIKEYYLVPCKYRPVLFKKVEHLIENSKEFHFHDEDVNDLVFDFLGIRLKDGTTSDLAEHLLRTKSEIKKEMPNIHRLKSLTDSTNSFYIAGCSSSVEWRLSQLLIEKNLNYIYYHCEPKDSKTTLDPQPIVPGLVVAAKKSYLESLPDESVVLTEERIKDDSFYTIELDQSDATNYIETHFGYTFEVEVQKSKRTHNLT